MKNKEIKNNLTQEDKEALNIIFQEVNAFQNTIKNLSIHAEKANAAAWKIIKEKTPNLDMKRKIYAWDSEEMTVREKY